MRAYASVPLTSSLPPLDLLEEVLYDLPPLEGVLLHWQTHGAAALTPGIVSLFSRRKHLLGPATLPGTSIQLLATCLEELYWLLGSSVQKIGPSRRRKNFILSLQTQESRCTIRSRQQQTHARKTICSRDGEASFMAGVLKHLLRLLDGCLHALSSGLARWTKPLTSSLTLQTLADLGRSKSELVAENAFLRHQLIILKRQVKRPARSKTDRVLLVLLARVVHTWQNALLVVQPDTLLRWHRELFRVVWKHKSKAVSPTPKIAAETIALIRQMATENRLWGAERIRGELLKLGIRVCKRTIQKYMRHVRTHQPRGQRWATDLAHACRTSLGVRLLAGHRSLLSTARRRSSSLNSSHAR
jgi:hypothetical protein